MPDANDLCRRDDSAPRHPAMTVAPGWRDGASQSVNDRALYVELVRHATLAPSSHNTQCWRFQFSDRSITILPDYTRRCPVVDPDDHHVFVSLGCAAENLTQAALAHGLRAEAGFDDATDALRIKLSPTAATRSPLFDAIALRQCTRADYDGRPLDPRELRLLEAAGNDAGVGLVMLTDRPTMERVLEFAIEGNAVQLRDPAFVRELTSWIRFNARDAARHGDGLYSACTGNPSIPSWLGRLALPWLITPRSENRRLIGQVRSSAGLAVFVGASASKDSWIAVGRAYERFALQATALGIRHAHLNQPVELASLRPKFAEALGMGGRRPDLVLRFGHGPTLARSPRRPVEAVLT